MLGHITSSAISDAIGWRLAPVVGARAAALGLHVVLVAETHLAQHAAHPVAHLVGLAVHGES